ncbi:uncharacterized protein LOC134816518 [Bolinopsis microptera]|uniref:uncharacterized protein LOC134816518 n=1 Tax=Bolinopsis microptera TaxID=2820187 RepID=UPI00307AE441
MWLLYLAATTLLTLLLSLLSKHVNYILRMVLYSWVFLVLAVVHMVYCPFFPKNRDNTYTLAPLFYHLSRLLLGITVEAEGEEHLESHEGGYILSPNHQSSLDTLCIARIWPHRAIILMKRSLLYVPFFGWAAYLSGHEFITRKSGASGEVRDHMNLINERIKNERLRVCVFPEGTRNKAFDGKMLPFKKGGFHMAQQCQAPIVPVVIYIPPSLYDGKNWVFNSGVIRMKVLEPISTVGLSSDDVTELTNSVQTKMQEALDELSKRA